MAETEGRVEASGDVAMTKNARDPGSLDSGGAVTVRATLTGDVLLVTVAAVVPYGGRTVTVTRTVDGTDALAKALATIRDDEADAVLKDGRREAARSMLVALDKGEEL
jgi:hypothetical protein